MKGDGSDDLKDDARDKTRPTEQSKPKVQSTKDEPGLTNPFAIACDDWSIQSVREPLGPLADNPVDQDMIDRMGLTGRLTAGKSTQAELHEMVEKDRAAERTAALRSKCPDDRTRGTRPSPRGSSQSGGGKGSWWRTDDSYGHDQSKGGEQGSTGYGWGSNSSNWSGADWSHDDRRSSSGGTGWDAGQSGRKYQEYDQSGSNWSGSKKQSTAQGGEYPSKRGHSHIWNRSNY